MTEQIISTIIARLAPNGFIERAIAEATYQPRTLPTGAQVMRTCPSPTGFVHIGTIYTAMLNDYFAHQSGGTAILRIEDTDKKREVPGATDAIQAAMQAFAIMIDESPLQGGAYGPYLQSERAKIYLGYAIDLLRAGRAYPCFATAEELEAAVKEQQAAKLRPGYYGKWALWRDQSAADIQAALDADLPFVLRFKSEGSHAARVQFTDLLKGAMELPQNDLDVPLIKSGDVRLPTYHLAHVVDDHLMRASIILRGDEWLPSTPLHIEIAQALGITPFTYAHIAPISILDQNGGGKRKLSKRKDPQADVQFWLQAGYPVDGVKAYLLGLANSSFEDWRREHPAAPLQTFPLTMEKLAQSRAPLLDMRKLEDLCKDALAALPQDSFNANLLAWAQVHQPDFYAILTNDPGYTEQVLAVERSGDQQRKDIAKWSDAAYHYGFFFDELFDTSDIAELLRDIPMAAQVALCEAFLQVYDPQLSREAWFASLQAVATKLGYATDMKQYKADPTAYTGSIADAARIIRAKLTGRNRTPDLWEIMRILGTARVEKRLR